MNSGAAMVGGNKTFCASFVKDRDGQQLRFLSSKTAMGNKMAMSFASSGCFQQVFEQQQQHALRDPPLSASWAIRFSVFWLSTGLGEGQVDAKSDGTITRQHRVVSNIIKGCFHHRRQTFCRLLMRKLGRGICVEQSVVVHR